MPVFPCSRDGNRSSGKREDSEVRQVLGGRAHPQVVLTVRRTDFLQTSLPALMCARDQREDVAEFSVTWHVLWPLRVTCQARSLTR